MGKLKPKASALELNERKRRLAAAIREMRDGSQPGDIFTPTLKTYIEHVVTTEMKGPQSKAARRTIREGNPAAEGSVERIKLAPNAIYPDDQPVSTVPPSLLLRLPKPPDGLAYAFVGRTMILRDTDADLIVDVPLTGTFGPLVRIPSMGRVQWPHTLKLSRSCTLFSAPWESSAG